MKKVKHSYITRSGPSFIDPFGTTIICSLVMIFRNETLKYSIQFDDESDRFRSLRQLVRYKHSELDRYDSMTKHQLSSESSYNKLNNGY